MLIGVDAVAAVRRNVCPLPFRAGKISAQRIYRAEINSPWIIWRDSYVPVVFGLACPGVIFSDRRKRINLRSSSTATPRQIRHCADSSKDVGYVRLHFRAVNGQACPCTRWCRRKFDYLEGIASIAREKKAITERYHELDRSSLGMDANIPTHFGTFQ